jgi:hypothetical protein
MTMTMTVLLLQGIDTMGDRLSRFARRVLDDLQRRQAPDAFGPKPDPPAPEPIPPAVTEPPPPQTVVTASDTIPDGTLRHEHRRFCNDALKTLIDTYPIANDPKTHLAVFIFKQYPDGSETVGYGTTASVAGLRDRMKLWSSQDPPKPTVVPNLSAVIVPGTRIH